MLGVLEGSGETGSVIVMDLAAAQRELGRLGRVDRIHLKVPDEPSLAEWQRRLQAALPRASSCVRPAARRMRIAACSARFA